MIPNQRRRSERSSQASSASRSQRNADVGDDISSLQRNFSPWHGENGDTATDAAGATRRRQRSSHAGEATSAHPRDSFAWPGEEGSAATESGQQAVQIRVDISRGHGVLGLHFHKDTNPPEVRRAKHGAETFWAEHGIESGDLLVQVDNAYTLRSTQARIQEMLDRRPVVLVFQKPPQQASSKAHSETEEAKLPDVLDNGSDVAVEVEDDELEDEQEDEAETSGNESWSSYNLRMRKELGKSIILKVTVHSARGLQLVGQEATSLFPRVLCEVPGSSISKLRTRPASGIHPIWKHAGVLELNIGEPLRFVVCEEASNGSLQTLGDVYLASQQFYPSGWREVLELQGPRLVKSQGRPAILRIKISIFRGGTHDNLEVCSEDGQWDSEAEEDNRPPSPFRFSCQEMPVQTEPEEPEVFKEESTTQTTAPRVQDEGIRIRVLILSAQGLPISDNELDTFCACEILGKPATRFRTRTQQGTASPIWNHVCQISGYSLGDLIRFSVWDEASSRAPALEPETNQPRNHLRVAARALLVGRAAGGGTAAEDGEGNDNAQLAETDRSAGAAGLRAAVRAAAWTTGGSDRITPSILPDPSGLDGLQQGGAGSDAGVHQISHDQIPRQAAQIIKGDKLLGEVVLSPEKLYPRGFFGDLALVSHREELSSEAVLRVRVDLLGAMFQQQPQPPLWAQVDPTGGPEPDVWKTLNVAKKPRVTQPDLVQALSKDTNISARIGRASGLGDLRARKGSDIYCTGEVLGRPSSRFRTMSFTYANELVWDHEQQLTSWAKDESLRFVVWEEYRASRFHHASSKMLGFVVLSPQQFVPDGFDQEVTLVAQAQAFALFPASQATLQIQIRVDSTYTDQLVGEKWASVAQKSTLRAERAVRLASVVADDVTFRDARRLEQETWKQVFEQEEGAQARLEKAVAQCKEASSEYAAAGGLEIDRVEHMKAEAREDEAVVAELESGEPHVRVAAFKQEELVAELQVQETDRLLVHLEDELQSANAASDAQASLAESAAMGMEEEVDDKAEALEAFAAATAPIWAAELREEQTELETVQHQATMAREECLATESMIMGFKARQARLPELLEESRKVEARIKADGTYDRAFKFGVKKQLAERAVRVTREVIGKFKDEAAAWREHIASLFSHAAEGEGEVHEDDHEDLAAYFEEATETVDALETVEEMGEKASPEAIDEMEDRASLETQMIRVTVVGAKGVRSMDLWGKSDPFCTCEVVGNPDLKFYTPAIGDAANPIWDHVHDFADYTSGAALHFQVFDEDEDGHDELIGDAILSPEMFNADGFEGEVELTLHGRSAIPRSLGEQHVRTTLQLRVDVGAAGSFEHEGSPSTGSFGDAISLKTQRFKHHTDAADEVADAASHEDARARSERSAREARAKMWREELECKIDMDNLRVDNLVLQILNEHNKEREASVAAQIEAREAKWKKEEERRNWHTSAQREMQSILDDIARLRGKTVAKREQEAKRHKLECANVFEHLLGKERDLYEKFLEEKRLWLEQNIQESERRNVLRSDDLRNIEYDVADLRDQLYSGKWNLKGEAQEVHYQADNSKLSSPSEGMSYRKSKRIDDITDLRPMIRWGEVVSGYREYEGNGWLRVGEFFLPMKVNGVEVLKEIDMEEDVTKEFQQELEHDMFNGRWVLQEAKATYAITGSDLNWIDTGATYKFKARSMGKCSAEIEGHIVEGRLAHVGWLIWKTGVTWLSDGFDGKWRNPKTGERFLIEGRVGHWLDTGVTHLLEIDETSGDLSVQIGDTVAGAKLMGPGQMVWTTGEKWLHDGFTGRWRREGKQPRYVVIGSKLHWLDSGAVYKFDVDAEATCSAQLASGISEGKLDDSGLLMWSNSAVWLREEWTVRLDITWGGKIGISLKSRKDGTVCIAKVLEGSHAEMWNKQDPLRAVQPDDVVVRVNTRSGVDEMVQEMKRAQIINMVIFRKPDLDEELPEPPSEPGTESEQEDVDLSVTAEIPGEEEDMEIGSGGASGGASGGSGTAGRDGRGAGKHAGGEDSGGEGDSEGAGEGAAADAEGRGEDGGEAMDSEGGGRPSSPREGGHGKTDGEVVDSGDVEAEHDEAAAEEEDLESLTVKDLKDKLKTAGLEVKGTKSELVARLKEHAAKQEDHATDGKPKVRKTDSAKKDPKTREEKAAQEEDEGTDDTPQESEGTDGTQQEEEGTDGKSKARKSHSAKKDPKTRKEKDPIEVARQEWFAKQAKPIIVMVEIVSAKGLTFPGGKTGFFCSCQAHGKPDFKIETPEITKTEDPEWNHKEPLYNIWTGDDLEFSVRHHITQAAKKEIGSTSLRYADFRDGFDKSVPLEDATETDMNATLHIRLSIVADCVSGRWRKEGQVDQFRVSHGKVTFLAKDKEHDFKVTGESTCTMKVDEKEFEGDLLDSGRLVWEGSKSAWEREGFDGMWKREGTTQLYYIEGQEIRKLDSETIYRCSMEGPDRLFMHVGEEVLLGLLHPHGRLEWSNRSFWKREGFVGLWQKEGWSTYIVEGNRVTTNTGRTYKFQPQPGLTYLMTMPTASFTGRLVSTDRIEWSNNSAWVRRDRPLHEQLEEMLVEEKRVEEAKAAEEEAAAEEAKSESEDIVIDDEDGSNVHVKLSIIGGVGFPLLRFYHAEDAHHTCCCGVFGNPDSIVKTDDVNISDTKEPTWNHLLEFDCLTTDLLEFRISNMKSEDIAKGKLKYKELEPGIIREIPLIMVGKAANASEAKLRVKMQEDREEASEGEVPAEVNSEEEKEEEPEEEEVVEATRFKLKLKASEESPSESEGEGVEASKFKLRFNNKFGDGSKEALRRRLEEKRRRRRRHFVAEDEFDGMETLEV